MLSAAYAAGGIFLKGKAPQSLIAALSLIGDNEKGRKEDLEIPIKQQDASWKRISDK